MGLESFPAAPPKERTLGDFFRSRSVNSIDFLSHFDPIKHGSRRHRRVRTSVSFREGINDEYASVVLLFEEELQGELMEERREKKNGKNINEVEEERKSVYGKKVERMGGNHGREVSRKFHAGSGFQKKDLEGEMRANLKERRPVKTKKKCEEEILKKRKKKSKILDHKLNCDFKKIHSGRSTATEEVRGASPRRKHQPYQNAKSKSPSSCTNQAVCAGVEVREIIDGKNERKMKTNDNCYYKKTMEEISMLNEDGVRENWINYGMELKFENFKDLCQLFGEEILEGLLRQFVDDLVLHFGQ